MPQYNMHAWVRYFVWNFKGNLWNSKQNILPIHWKIRFLYSVEILTALRFRRWYMFWNTPRASNFTSRGYGYSYHIFIFLVQFKYHMIYHFHTVHKGKLYSYKVHQFWYNEYVLSVKLIVLLVKYGIYPLGRVQKQQHVIQPRGCISVSRVDHQRWSALLMAPLCSSKWSSQNSFNETELGIINKK